MNTRPLTHLLFASLLAILPCSIVLAQGTGDAPSTSPQNSTTAKVDRALSGEPNWYFSWGYSRQQYAPSDIRVSQPGLGNDFTVRQAAGSDFPATVQETVTAIRNFDLTLPQENVRVGKFMNPEKTFAIE